MKIIIVGGGRIGYAIARQLVQEGHDLTVIEQSAAQAEFISTTLDVIVVQGRANVEQLQIAGTGSADLLIAATMSDETNIISCAVAKKLGAKRTIARIRDEEYYQDSVLLREELGLSLSINPERSAAKEISRTLRFPVATRVEPFARGLVELVEYRVPANGKLCGVQLKDFRNRFSSGVLVCTLEREGTLHIPNGDYTIQAGDLLSLVGMPHELHALFRKIGELQHAAQGVMIVGGGRVSERLAMELEKMHIHAVILERDEQRCYELKEVLPDTTVVCGDGSEPNTLREEGLLDTDALVAVTKSDAMNLVISTFGASQKVPKVVTLLNEENFIQLAQTYGLTTVVQPAAVIAARITEYVRAMENSADVSGVETLRLVADGRAEVLEFIAREGASLLDKPLKELKLRKSVLVATIIRGDKGFIPAGSDAIQAGDRVIVVTTHHGMKRLEDILQ